MYSSNYDNMIIRNETNCFFDFVSPFLNDTMSLVDFGCGTCSKTILLSNKVKEVIGIDNNLDVLTCAKKKTDGVSNISLCYSDNMATPFSSHRFDVASACLTTWSAAEVHRLLKKNGLFFLEVLCPDDKEQLKKSFGQDEYGWRGRLSNQSCEEHLYYLIKALNTFFEIISIKDYYQNTVLSKEGFIQLLKETPTIRSFSISKDTEIIDSLVKNDCVSFNEHRKLICARGLD